MEQFKYKYKYYIVDTTTVLVCIGVSLIGYVICDIYNKCKNFYINRKRTQRIREKKDTIINNCVTTILSCGIISALYCAANFYGKKNTNIAMDKIHKTHTKPQYNEFNDLYDQLFKNLTTISPHNNNFTTSKCTETSEGIVQNNTHE
jgi:hypothetical protein